MADITRDTIHTLVSDHQSGAALPQLTTFCPQSSNVGNQHLALVRTPELDFERLLEEVKPMVRARSIRDTRQTTEAQ
jgi:hypothetical protein